MREIIESARTVEQAIQAACEKLGVERDEANIEILQFPKKGFLGFVSAANMAKVRVTVGEEEVEVKAQAPKETAAPVPTPKKETTPKAVEKAPAPKPVEEKKAEEEVPTVVTDEMRRKVEKAKAYVASILHNMGLTVEITEEVTPTGAKLNLEGEGLGIIIGRRGETLDAVQYLAGLVANRGDAGYYRITIDSAGYREKREQTLAALAKKIANQVARTGRSSTLEPMNPYERRIIHSTVSQVEGITSTSIGEEPYRRVVISSKNKPRGGYRKDGPRGGGVRGKNHSGNRQQRPAAPRAAEPVKSTGEAKHEASVQPLYSKIDLSDLENE